MQAYVGRGQRLACSDCGTEHAPSIGTEFAAPRRVPIEKATLRAFIATPVLRGVVRRTAPLRLGPTGTLLALLAFVVLASGSHAPHYLGSIEHAAGANPSIAARTNIHVFSPSAAVTDSIDEPLACAIEAALRAPAAFLPSAGLTCLARIPTAELSNVAGFDSDANRTTPLTRARTRAALGVYLN